MISLEFEEKSGFSLVGIDEAGRGPLVGPVYASAAILKPNFNIDQIKEINDSKKLSESKRIKIYNNVVSNFFIGIGSASVDEIDGVNILNATKIAMQRAYYNLLKIYDISKCHILVDGNFTPFSNDNIKAEFLIEGDAKCLSIAAASIAAKVERDNLMLQLAKMHPNYSWEKNKGYGTKDHIEAIKSNGLTEYHRKSFIKKIIANQG